jgi:hypothetical protein
VAFADNSMMAMMVLLAATALKVEMHLACAELQHGVLYLFRFELHVRILFQALPLSSAHRSVHSAKLSVQEFALYRTLSICQLHLSLSEAPAAVFVAFPKKILSGMEY